ncbi:DMT family transporter [Terrimesophilobacter mesophilus]|uniref:DMT family transporter n=2 Tax=Terrimesophilobacter mesophilus TaxID=433647 RepID=A0A4R8VF39_9MICO|nr:DMT family transporter [Terrimesophilobacter mesophilus]TFB80820.1 DMT family transporter [Terrimesophilobacter mesophilus]
MGLVWGASFLFMKVALDGVSFTQIAWSREILGALTLGIVMIVGRHRLPKEGIVWLHFVVIAVTNCVIPHTLFAWAEQHVSSGLAAIYNSITPIATAILAAVAFRVEKLVRGQIIGVLLGVAGVVVIIAPWQYTDLSGDLWGQLACIAAAISYGVAISYMRKFVSPRPISGTTVAFMQIGTSAAIMLLLTPILAVGPVDLSFPVVASLVLLGALGTGLAYIWNIGVLRAWGPTNVSTVTYLIPVVAVVLGFLVLGETLSWNEPVGAVLVLVGILFTQQRLKLRRAATIAPGQ